MSNNSIAETGKKIEWDEGGRPVVPNHPIIPYIIGDGTGPDIWAAARPVFDAAVSKAYGKDRTINWMELLAGERAQRKYGMDRPLPDETLEKISDYGIAIKGPLTTPVGTGLRSLNVELRRRLDLYACVRPVRYIPGLPSPVRHPEYLDIVIFRENTEDVYAGLEWPAGSAEAKEILSFIQSRFKSTAANSVSVESAIGIKPMSEYNTARLVTKAVQYAVQFDRDNITLVHKGNIMKYTEGAFRDWGYKVAINMYPDKMITENDLAEKFGGMRPKGSVLIKDRMADAMFQQLLLRPKEYDVIVTPNLNGDYLSDAAAAQVGGLGMAPGANIGDRCAILEATHGSAPKYAGLDKVNPGSLILSGVEMLRLMGWKEAADIIMSALIGAVKERIVTYDLARQMEGATEVKCSEFGEAIRKRIGA